MPPSAWGLLGGMGEGHWADRDSLGFPDFSQRGDWRVGLANDISPQGRRAVSLTSVALGVIPGAFPYHGGLALHVVWDLLALGLPGLLLWISQAAV